MPQRNVLEDDTARRSEPVQRRAPPSRLLGFALVVAGLTHGTRILVEASKHLSSAWPGFRLGFSAQLEAGLDLYAVPGGGPILGDIYGPVAAIFYLPSLWAPDVTLSIVWAEVCTVLGVGGLFVACCLMRAPRGARDQQLAAAAVSVIGIGVMLALPGLRHCLIQVHADAPSLIFGVLSCLVWSRAARFSAARTVSSGAFWALAVLSKQIACFVIVAQLAMIWRWFGVRAAVLHAACGLSLLLAAFYGSAALIGSQPKDMFFYLVSVPKAHPLLVSDENLLVSRAVALFLPLTVMWLATWVAVKKRGIGEIIRDSSCRDVALLLVVSIATAPMSLVAGIKEGGYLNNYHALFYGLLAASLAVIERLRSDRPERGLKSSRCDLLAVATLASVLLVPTDLRDELGQLRTVVKRLPKNPQARASAYLRDHADAYFPWHPLSLALQSGGAYNSFDGLRTLELAGVTVSQDEFFAFAPRTPRLIVLPAEGRGISGSFSMLGRYYPDYEKVKPPKGLKGFRVYAKR